MMTSSQLRRGSQSCGEKCRLCGCSELGPSYRGQRFFLPSSSGSGRRDRTIPPRGWPCLERGERRHQRDERCVGASPRRGMSSDSGKQLVHFHLHSLAFHMRTSNKSYLVSVGFKNFSFFASCSIFEARDKPGPGNLNHFDGINRVTAARDNAQYHRWKQKPCEWNTTGVANQHAG